MQRATLRVLLCTTTLLVAWSSGRTARADAISFSSWGDIGGTSGTPIGNFAINSTSGTLLGPGSFTLGSFQARDLPSGSGLTYTNMPFFIDVQFTPQGGGSSSVSELQVQGVLNGTVTGTTSSNVVASVTSIQSIGQNALPFPLTAVGVLGPQTLAPSGINGGVTALAGQITSGWNVPEPTPLAMAGLMAALGACRLASRRRAEARASAG